MVPQAVAVHTAVTVATVATIAAFTSPEAPSNRTG